MNLSLFNIGQFATERLLNDIIQALYTDDYIQKQFSSELGTISADYDIELIERFSLYLGMPHLSFVADGGNVVTIQAHGSAEFQLNSSILPGVADYSHNVRVEADLEVTCQIVIVRNELPIGHVAITFEDVHSLRLASVECPSDYPQLYAALLERVAVVSLREDVKRIPILPYCSFFEAGRMIVDRPRVAIPKLNGNPNSQMALVANTRPNGNLGSITGLSSWLTSRENFGVGIDQTLLAQFADFCLNQESIPRRYDEFGSEDPHGINVIEEVKIHCRANSLLVDCNVRNLPTDSMFHHSAKVIGEFRDGQVHWRVEQNGPFQLKLPLYLVWLILFEISRLAFGSPSKEMANAELGGFLLHPDIPLGFWGAIPYQNGLSMIKLTFNLQSFVQNSEGMFLAGQTVIDRSSGSIVEDNANA